MANAGNVLVNLCGLGGGLDYITPVSYKTYRKQTPIISRNSRYLAYFQHYTTVRRGTGTPWLSVAAGVDSTRISLSFGRANQLASDLVPANLPHFKEPLQPEKWLLQKIPG